MQFKVKPMVSRVLGLSAALLLVFVLACGSAAPAPTTGPTTAPTTAGGSTPAPTAMVTGAPTQSGEGTVNPGKLVWMTQGWGAGRFENVLSGTGTSNQYTRLMHGFPIAADASGKMVPGLAEAWSVSEDGKTWTVTLRDGGMFHDGNPVTPEDIAFTWTHEWGPDAANYAKSTTSQAQSRNTESIRVEGNNIIAVLKAADGGFPAGLLSEAGPNWIGHIRPARTPIVDEAASAAYDKDPVGAGPMRVTRVIPSELIAMERFGDFYYQPKNGLPEDRRMKFQNVEMRLVPEEATRVAAIRAGEADIAPVSLSSRKQVEADGGRLIFGPEGVYVRPMWWGCWSPKAPPCKDKRVRQAFAYALDKELIGKELYGGPEVFQVKGWAYVTPSSLGYSPDLDPFPYDPEKARQLLAEAGFPNGEGFEKFTINTWISSAMPLLPEQAQLAADMWERNLNIETEVKIGDEGALNAASRSDELWGQMTYRDNEARYDGGSITRSSFGTKEQGNRFHEDDALYAEIAAAMAVTDPNVRPDALNKIYKRLHDEQWEMAVGYINIPWAVGPNVADWKPFAFSFYPSGTHTITLK